MAEERGTRQRRSQDEDGEGRQTRSSATRKKSTAGKSRQRPSARTASKKASSSGRRSGEGQRSDQDGQKPRRDRGEKEAASEGSAQGSSQASAEQESSGQGEQESSDQGEQESSDQGEQESSGQGEQESSDQAEQESTEERAADDDGSGGGAPPRELSVVELVKRGRNLLAELTGRQPESVSGLDRHDGGWRLTLEVVEVNRIPPTTDILGTYQLDLTEDGELNGYRRTDRYYRNQAQQHGE